MYSTLWWNKCIIGRICPLREIPKDSNSRFPCAKLTVLGDANAKIGREDLFKPTRGGIIKQKETNKDGLFLVDFLKKEIWYM